MTETVTTWAVFHREFNWSRPKSRHSFKVRPKPEPQQWPRDVIAAAIEAGAAKPARRKRK